MASDQLDQRDGGWADASETRRQLGTISAWLGQVPVAPAAQAHDAAQRVEALGFSALWLPESPMHRESFTTCAMLLSATTELALATGIANIWARDATASRNGAFTLAEAFPGRFVMALGISHKGSVGLRGHHYSRPVTSMAQYLDGLNAIAWQGPALPRPVPLMLGALRTKMLELARDRCAGVHPYFMPVEHTREARRILGPQAVIAPEVAVVVDPDPERARARARAYAELYLGLANYVNALRWLGYEDADVAAPGSDRLIDAVIAWGDAETVAERVRDQLKAGADHVCIQPVGTNLRGALEELEQLAPLLPMGAGQA